MCCLCGDKGFVRLWPKYIFNEWVMFLDGKNRTVRIYKLCQCQKEKMNDDDDGMSSL